MIDYRFLAPAEMEMVEAALYYDGAHQGLGADFLDDVDRTIDPARELPQLGNEIRSGIRRLLFQRFPYELVYLVERDRIVIVAVAHQRGRPGYWRERLGI